MNYSKLEKMFLSKKMKYEKIEIDKNYYQLKVSDKNMILEIFYNDDFQSINMYKDEYIHGIEYNIILKSDIQNILMDNQYIGIIQYLNNHMYGSVR